MGGEEFAKNMGKIFSEENVSAVAVVSNGADPIRELNRDTPF